jgi:prepilin-type N-terminal cleavage/methylation domain-containing protein
MKLRKTFGLRKQRGFSLIEMLVAMGLLGIVLGSVFIQMEGAQQRMTTENVKVDDFQQVRDFVDQFFRDINQIGDPNPRLFDTVNGTWSPALQSPLINDKRFAVGLTKIDANEIHFEGSVSGIGSVQVVDYMVNGSGTCTRCLQRSQINKQDGDPLTGQGTFNWGTEVNDVVSSPIFKYFDVNGNQITALPVDISTTAGANTIATVKTVQINLRVSDPLIVDTKTGQPIEGTFEGEISLNNCSMASTGQAMSCK